MAVTLPKDNEDLIKILKKQGVSKYCSFLIYPKLDKKNPNSNTKENVTLDKDYIEDGSLANNININNDLMFVGLNAAKRKETKDKKYDFQAMHDNSKKNNDYRTARMVRDANQSQKIRGSFVCDIISNVVQTKLINMDNIIDKLDHLSDSFNVPNEDFDFNQIPPVKFTNYNKWINKRDESQHKIDELKAFINKNIKYDENYVNENLSHYDYNLGYAKGRLVYERKDIFNQLYNHIVKYDIAAFVYLVRLIQPKEVMCFGTYAYKLVELINRKCDLNITPHFISHFADSVSDKQRLTEINKIVK